MTQLLPLIYSLSLFIFCLGYVLRSIDVLIKLRERIEILSEQDVRLMSCAQKKSNQLNLWESYYFLLERYPHDKVLLNNIRTELADRFPQVLGSCNHEFFSSVKASSKRQNREDYPGFWPNWIQATQLGM